MAAESWVLGGVILTSGTFTLMELTADPPRARRDWITAADSEAAALFRQSLHENRTITMKLRVTPQASMDTAMDKLGLIVDKLRAASATPAGVALVWTPNGSTRSCTFDVLAGEITGLPISLSGDGYSWLLSSPIVTIEMTCGPYWRGVETLTSTASSSTPFVTKEITGVTGDVPALGRLIVTDTATQSRRHVEWGLEGPLTYNAATSLLVDSDDMVTSGFAGAQQSATAGAYDPNASGNTSIRSDLYSGQTTAVCGTGNLSHVGSFRVKARVYTNVGNMVRLSYQVGDGPLTTNEWATSAFESQWIEMDLGTISIPAVLSGTQRWTGRVEALNQDPAAGGIAVDYLILVPVADGYGKARASYAYSSGVVTGFDNFASTTAAAALNARVSPIGGTWATSGSTTDFAFADDFSGEQVKRATTADAGLRFAVLGSTNYTDTQVDVNVYRSSTTFAGDLEQGVIARWVDSSNYLRATIFRDSTGATRTWSITQRVAGVDTVLAITAAPTSVYNIYFCVRIVVLASGRVLAWLLDATRTTTLAYLETTSTVFAAAGTLATGKPGFCDRYTGGSAASRYYDDFGVSTPPAEPIALYSGRNLQVRYDDVIRQDSTGTYSGRPPSYRGSRFLVPVGTSRVLVKARRNDIEATVDDNVIDATQIQIGWTPRGLAVPRA